MRSVYSDVNWFVRAVRVVPVIAGAALLGGMIGGFAMFALDSALTWQPPSEPQTQNAASAEPVQTNKQVRIVGGAIPDPSAGMSGPPPAPQQQQQPQHSAANAAQARISSQLLTPKPLGPTSQLQPQTATVSPAQAPTASQPQNQTTNQTQTPIQAPTPATSATQPTHWPDALSRAHKNAANTASAPAQTAPPPATAQPSENANSKTSETDRKTANGGHARAGDQAATTATADDQDRGNSSRHGRHSRGHAIAGGNGSRNANNNEAATAPAPRRQDARNYDRLYDSYGNRRERSYGNPRQQVYGDDQNASYGSSRDRSGARGQSYGDTRYDQNDSASPSDESRSDTRRYGRDTRYRGRSRVREQADESDRSPSFEARQPRSEPFWGGGFFRRDDWGD